MKKFLKDLLERCGATFIEAFLGGIGGASTFNQIDWKIVLTSAAFATMLAVAKCLLASLKGEGDSASFIK